MNNRYTDQSFQGYFTNANDIKKTMIELLGDVSNLNVLEPCFGEGAFIKDLVGTPATTCAIDIDKSHFSFDGKSKNCEFFNLDFIDYFVNPENQTVNLPDIKYDATICNPPYGLKFSKEYREIIKKKFPNIYARESYALFFYLTLSLLKNGGKYCFIMPDTFLTSRNLGYLRSFIIETAKPTHIIQFKSKRFGSVKFSYGNLCIIYGEKNELKNSDKITWSDAIKKDNESLSFLLKNDSKIVNGKYFIDEVKESWVHPDLLSLVVFNRDTVTLDDIAECKTGIYTGDNKTFCGYNENHPPRIINGHPVLWDNVTIDLSKEDMLNGLLGDVEYVPFIRGGHRKPFESTKSCIRWDKSAINFYDKDQKARLQNRSYYFKKGLAVPMVTSGKISASLMNNSIFDQGVVGVFAKDDKYTDFLLIYLNDEISYKLKLSFAPGANNSANYLKKLKIPKLTNNELKEATDIVNKAKEIGWDETKILRNEFIAKII